MLVWIVGGYVIQVLFSEANSLFAESRIQACCRYYGLTSECMRFCSYDNPPSQDEIYAIGLQCYKQVQISMYCITEGADHGACCARAGILEDNPCMSMCRGEEMPNLCLIENALEFTCTNEWYNPTMVDCFREGASRRRRWNTNKTLEVGCRGKPDELGIFVESS